jgi:hypothetical protein
MTRLIRNLTGLAYGLIFVALLAIWVETARSDTPKTYIGIIVAYQKGEVVASESIGYAATQGDCMRGVQAAMTEVQPKPGVTLAAVCTPAPPAPADPQHQS